MNFSPLPTMLGRVSKAFVSLVIGLLLNSPLHAQDGTGNQRGVFDAWQGQSAPEGSARSYELGKVLTVKLVNLDGWLMKEIVDQRLSGKPYLSEAQVTNIREHLKDENKTPLSADTSAAVSLITWDTVAKLYPVIDGISLTKAPRLAYEKIESGNKDTIHHIRFIIDRDVTDAVEWKNLLRTSSHCIRPTLTLAFDPGTGLPPRQMSTMVKPDTTGKKPDFTLLIYSPQTLVICGIVMLVVILVLLWLAPKSEILRDPSQPLRPDGTYPWSLSRAQMAIWFVLVVGAFLFLWVVTSQINVLNNTALTLIGIGSATALSAAALSNSDRDTAAVIDAERRYGDRRYKSWKLLKQEYSVKLSVLQERSKRLEEARTSEQQATNRVSLIENQFRSEQAANPSTSLSQAQQTELEKAGNEKKNAATNLEEIEGEVGPRLATELAEANEEIKFMRRGWAEEILYDWMTENKIVSFHRFQMLMWTLVLALIFVVHVLKYLEMPTFDGTLLALTGISAGTYLGFKFPKTEPPAPLK